MFNEEIFAQKLKLIKEEKPLIHCLTNNVVTNLTANILLAIGSSPAMVTSSKETKSFAKIASSLLVNIGTITKPQEYAMLKAVKSAFKNNIPWVLDPVAYGILKYRNKVCHKLIKFKPTVIRGNASEIYSLAGFNGASKGADSTISSANAIDAAKLLAKKHKNIVAVTGREDYVTNGKDTYKLNNGSEKLTLVTGIGCSLSAMISAYLPICDSPIQAALTAISHMNIASEIANVNTKGIGSFATYLLDQLYLLSNNDEGINLLKCEKI